MIKYVLIATLSAFVGIGMTIPNNAYAANAKPAASAKVSKVRWTAGQCRARCDRVWMLGRERSICYSKVCTKYPEH